jgi:DNA-binding IclR family transcriptional regulator
MHILGDLDGTHASEVWRFAGDFHELRWIRRRDRHRYGVDAARVCVDRVVAGELDIRAVADVGPGER